ncbi:uncharacterized protein LOC132724323 [Ruditapes philippinarum]|uniref:uncharacterized protein LOC132724323 n=1 Tax=Ruditapes philippinarum TaxID=129788 RepID=UPI00295BCF73|nr:uncharacterized protein LOC132724323 [Ruditapes philippinarum]
MFAQVVIYLQMVVLFDGVSAAINPLYRQQRETRNFTIGIEEVSVKKIIPIENDYDQCYIHITVHNSSSFRYGLQGAVVTVVSRRQDSVDNFNYTGYSTGLTDSNGRACILVHCRAEAVIFVEKNNIRVFALNETLQKSRLPMYFAFDLKFNNEFIFTYTYPWGIVDGRNGPVFYSNEKNECINTHSNNYHFVFSYLSIPDFLNDTVAPITSNDFFNGHVWYYGTENDRKTCYLKVKTKTFSSALSIVTSSYLNTENGQRLGTFYTGPQYDINKAETSERAACIEFRCPAVFYINFTDMDTFIRGEIKSGPQNGCCLRSQNTNLFQTTPFGFSSAIPLNPHQSYGPNEGIYMSVDSRSARARCFTGHDFLGSEYVMDINKGFAFEYDCIPNAICEPLHVLGK